MSNNTYEVVVIGGGPAGYVAAIEAASRGYSVACISPELGGTCLHRGCIPSKFLLHYSRQLPNINQANLEQLMSKKQRVVDQLANGIHALFKQYKITWICDTAKIIDRYEKRLNIHEQTLAKCAQISSGDVIKPTKALVLATGSTPIIVNNNSDQQQCNTSDDALSWTEVPKNLCIVGAGYIGLELANVWSNFGSKVTVVDLSPNFLPFLDDDVSKIVRKNLNFDLKLGVTVAKQINNDIASTNGQVTLTDGQIIAADKVLYAIGRKASVNDLVKHVNIDIQNNLVTTNEFMQTNIKEVYAIGDITSGPMLAHKGSHQALVAMSHLQNINPPEYPAKSPSSVYKMDLIPSVIYIKPEVATVGLTERDLLAKGWLTGKLNERRLTDNAINGIESVDNVRNSTSTNDARDSTDSGIKSVNDSNLTSSKRYYVLQKSFATNGRAISIGDTTGFVKVIVDEFGVILGATIVGCNAESLICQVLVGMSFGATAQDFTTMCYPHPSFDELLRETMCLWM